MLGVSATMFAASTAMIRLDIISDTNADSNDKVLLVENSAYSAARDQSGDMQKPDMPTANPDASVQIFALTGFADYARAGQLATDNLDGTQLGFTTNTADAAYTIKVYNAVFATGIHYYLIDKYANATMEIVKDALYPFTAPEGATIENRFEIRALAEVPGMTLAAHEDPEHAGDFYCTFFHSGRAFQLPAGAEAYVATVSANALNLVKVADGGQVIPKNVALILKANAASIALGTTSAAPVTISAANDLLGLDYEADVPANCYVFSGHSTDNQTVGVGFYLYEGAKLAANKAYVVLANSAPRRLPFVFAGEQSATGIDNTNAEIKSIKTIENGALIIEKNGVRYNAMGQIVK